MPLWIIECSVCGKPFEREAPVMPVSVPPAAIIVIPEHDMLQDQSGEPMKLVPCSGATAPGIGKGLKEEYRDRWGRRPD